MEMVEEMHNLCEDIVASRFERTGAVNEIKKDTAELLDNYEKERKEMSAELRRDLDKGEEDRKTEFNEMMTGIKGDVSGIKKDTAELLDSYEKERKGMHEEWQRMVKPRAEVKVKEEEEEIEVGEAELGKLRGKVLEIINASPNGISLTGIGLKLGVEWRKLIRSAKELLEEGKIKKEDLNYFPLKEEEKEEEKW